MSTKLVLNRREGVVAAQDVHLNRSVYSKPLVYSISDFHIIKDGITYDEEFILSVSGNVASYVSLEQQRALWEPENHAQFTVVFQQVDFPTISSSIVLKPSAIADWKEEHLGFTALFKERHLPMPKSTVVMNKRKANYAPMDIQLYFNTIVLDKFHDIATYKELGYKESFDDPQN